MSWTLSAFQEELLGECEHPHYPTIQIPSTATATGVGRNTTDSGFFQVGPLLFIDGCKRILEAEVINQEEG